MRRLLAAAQESCPPRDNLFSCFSEGAFPDAPIFGSSGELTSKEKIFITMQSRTFIPHWQNNLSARAAPVPYLTAISGW